MPLFPFLLFQFKSQLFLFFSSPRLDCSWQLRTHILANPIHILHLRQYPACDPLQHIPVHLLHRSSHGINRINRPNNHHLFKHPCIVLYAHGPEIRHHSKVLLHLLIQPCLGKLFPQDDIGFANCLQSVPGDYISRPDRGRGMADNIPIMGQAQFHAPGSHLILEELL